MISITLEITTIRKTSNQQAELPGKDFKFKRIEDWVNDLQHVDLSEATDETIWHNDELPREPVVVDKPTIGAAKVDVIKLTPRMEAAKKVYILSNCFCNYSPAVRITAGALPRGLHALNLSNNSISVIEGLCELTRLRVLDLSYNRILRLGHGLASCSSLKELYLAGNKISKIEGLHRLLKLTMDLDLRFNMLSTTKCLGQLAANYSSLQALSLEGNPAQKNVDDEQLRNYLLGLLPNMVYYKQTKQQRCSACDKHISVGPRSQIRAQKQ